MPIFQKLSWLNTLMLEIFRSKKLNGDRKLEFHDLKNHFHQ
ncbi:MAG: hypothetical protein SAJ12_21210 [Jaaginema sp. PMC 1079.18]|nr:hypothetical protein [Jaaginema sp. PMC 1080.18]MEC4853507.1 hypothetical protein [Jaaginema sp. PMC 1079.18]MEC4868616.1 hypothetical protein [Jaaginema sp. PMC 1078.18]